MDDLQFVVKSSACITKFAIFYAYPYKTGYLGNEPPSKGDDGSSLLTPAFVVEETAISDD